MVDFRRVKDDRRWEERSKSYNKAFELATIFKKGNLF